MSFNDLHAEWLSLIEISGPFLAVPVLKEVFPQGLEQLDVDKCKRLRQAYDEWRDALENDDPRFPELHQAWIAEVLDRGLELDEEGRGDVLKRGTSIPDKLIIDLPEYGVKLAPDAAVIDEQSGSILMLIQTFPVMTDLEASSKRDGWATSPAERMVQLCRQTGCRLGLLTNGERWMLVDAPVGAVTTFASWYARLWGQEPVTLQAFVHLLGIRRFFVDDSERLPALFDRSLKHQDEVTDALGEQVRRAVEVLIQALDKADLDRDRTLLANVSTAEIYEAALTVMMRLVFLLSAEERGLLLLGDERYEAHYALSTLRIQLRADSAEILERRWDAWSRLLALFRAVYGGIEHENLRMPALGGSLFDPDRFPFLEGRDKHSQWRTDPAKPLPIDNRTVLLLLDAIQQFQGRTLSYRALDVEQIGYVYEGLLERTVKRAKDVTLELDATKSAKSPWVTLTELETARKAGDEKLSELLRERSGSSASRIRNDLAKDVDDVLADKLLTACHADVALRDRVKPYANLLRVDPWGYPLVYPTGSFMVTTGSDRRETGTHYTPKSLTEAIVTETLTPVVYVGPAEGTPREEWQLKSASELLDLKICDPAMGSGAFLVQVCRWFAERLVEAWSQAETAGKYVTVDGEVRDTVTDEEPLPRDGEERIVIARRLIAERCLYGVDLNPLAVELAKLSIWLVTLAKGRPFGFLDHNLRCGDSLLGVHRLDQLTELTMTPGRENTQMRLFGRNIEQAVVEAIELRKRLRQISIRDIHDVEVMARLDAEAKAKLEAPERIADAFMAKVFTAGVNENSFDTAMISLSIEADQYLQGDLQSGRNIDQWVADGLSVDLPEGKELRRPFHWPLEFPEIFVSSSAGFDAILGNPPYLGGRKIRGAMGALYLEFLINHLFPNSSANADLCAFFLRRCASLSKQSAVNGFIATSSISEGDTRIVGLNYLLKNGWILIRAANKFIWPGTANVTVSPVWLYFGNWRGNVCLNNIYTPKISSYLTESLSEEFSPYKLKENHELSYQGSIPLGKGFVISPDKAREILKSSECYSNVIYPYLVGQELNIDPLHEPSKWIINFHDWPLCNESAPPNYIGPVATDYPACLDIVKELVYPERTRKKPNGEYALRKPLPQKWWIYGDKRPELYSRLSSLKWALAIATQATKYVAFGKVMGKRVYSHAIAIIASDDYAIAGLLSSSIHEAWARRYGSYNLLLLRYSPSDLFDTYPFPKITEALRILGKKYYESREKIMIKNSYGLTAFYNNLHNSQQDNIDFVIFRELQMELDFQVAKEYGWSDIDLNHDFHLASYLPESGQIRFTISEHARLEILRRLLELNHQRYEEEVTLGLHGKSVTKTKSARSKIKKGFTAELSAQTTLFDLPTQSTPESIKDSTTVDNENVPGTNATNRILTWLKAHTGWFPKSAVLNGCGISEDDWNGSINDLLRNRFIERQGEKRGARYRYAGGGK